MGKKVLVPVDESRCSKKAFEYTLEEAEELGNEIVVLRVISDFGYAGEVLEDVLNDQMSKAKNFLSDLKQKASEEGVNIETDIITGTDVSNEIVKYARENDVDLIVIGSRGQTNLETITLGSVSEGVVKRAHTPVLVIR